MPKTSPRKASDLMNQSAAARRIGVSRPTVVAMIARGELAAEVHAGMLLVTRVSVEKARRAREAAAA